jgi:hypothetical protein
MAPHHVVYFKLAEEKIGLIYFLQIHNNNHGCIQSFSTVMIIAMWPTLVTGVWLLQTPFGPFRSHVPSLLILLAKFSPAKCL